MNQAATADLFGAAKAARQAGDREQASALLEQLVGADPNFAPGWNLLGIVALESGRHEEAARAMNRALEIDPAPPFGWLNLARVHRARGEREQQLSCLNEALSRDAYLLPAILDKGDALAALNRADEAAELYRLLFEGIGETSQFPPPLQAQLAAARRWLEEANTGKGAVYERAVEQAAALHGDANLDRARAYAQQAAGRRKVYLNQPTGAHFPFLPAYEFFPEAMFPWFAQLEAATAEIRSELLALWAADDPNFRPYVARDDGTPLRQWEELNHSPRWSAYFLWEDGRRNDANCGRCPATAALLERLPMLDIPGKSPTAMFSVLKPRTRIPAHTGTTNTRTTIHLGLVIPPGCGFRVGAETRQWAEGKAWAFDDTIEHEAWNDSDSPRAILILDGWNPFLSEAEREVVRRIG